MTHCCGCMISFSDGILSKNKVEELEEEPRDTGDGQEPPSPPPPPPIEEWRAEHTDVAKENDNFTWTERTHIERKYVNNSRTDETRNSRTEEINRQPKIKWVREKTSERETFDGRYRRYYSTYCEVKYSGGQKTQETRNCQEEMTHIEKITGSGECTPETPENCHHTSPDDRS